MKPIIQNHLIFKEILKERPKDINKSQLGRLLVIVGSRDMSGAGFFVALSAFRSGIGIMFLAYPENLKEIYRKGLLESIDVILPETKEGSLSIKAYKRIEEIIKEKQIDLVTLGPGLTRNPETQKLILQIIKETQKPMVIDADGLNALASNGRTNKILREREFTTILTPHAGEMARLINKSKEFIKDNRDTIAMKYAKEWKVILVLKGYHTLIAEPEGRLIINKSGGPALATAGTGDVLTGIISTLVSQNQVMPFEATAAAVYLHGLAGDLATKDLGERSVIASDVINYLPKAILKAQTLTDS